MSDIEAQSKGDSVGTPEMQRSPCHLSGGHQLNRTNSEGIFVLSSEKQNSSTFSAVSDRSIWQLQIVFDKEMHYSLLLSNDREQLFSLPNILVSMSILERNL